MTTATMTTKSRKSLEPFLHDSVVFYPHQVDGIRWLLRKRNFLLADDMGLGKSLQALTIFCADVKEGKGDTLLVVCPVSLRSNWAEEIEKFTSIPYVLLGEELSPTTGKMKTLKPADRSAQIARFKEQVGPRILVLNYEQVKPHLMELKLLRTWMAVFDEAHMIKGANSQRTKACLELNSHRNGLLTGTPILNQVDELWPLLNKIAPNYFANYFAFRNRYCVFGGYQNKAIVGTKNQRELHEILGRVMLRRLKKDVLDLPDVNYVNITVDLSPLQRKLYDQCESEMRIESVDPNGNDVHMENALTQFLRLKQICGSPAFLGHPDESYKLDAVIERAKEVMASGEKLVIFTQFRHVLACIMKRLATAGLGAYELHGDVPRHDRQNIVHKWTADSEPAALVCMTQVAGVGLNLVAARNGFFVDELFVPGLNKQAVDRLHRIGQSNTQPVTIYTFTAVRTIEYRIKQILRTKEKTFDNVIEAVSVVRELLNALQGKS